MESPISFAAFLYILAQELVFLWSLEGEMCHNLVSPGRLTSDDIFKAPVNVPGSSNLSTLFLLFLSPSVRPHHSAQKSFLGHTHVPTPQGRCSDSSLAVPQTAERGESHISCAVASGCSRGDTNEHVVAWWCVRAPVGKAPWWDSPYCNVLWTM